VPFTFSEAATRALPEEDLCILDVREAPIRNRTTRFRLAQQNIMQYTFGSFVPGFAPENPGVNGMPYQNLVSRALENAVDEGRFRFGNEYVVDSNAIAKVTGDIFEVLSSAVLWNAAARWNRYMAEVRWPQVPRYARPGIKPARDRQVAVLNLPRRFDWVKLLVPSAQDEIFRIRAQLAGEGMGLPTSTPDLAVVALPAEYRDDGLWRTELDNLRRENQTVLGNAYKMLEGRVEPGEILLAVAFKVSLRSDRLYQPLYEANIMQLLLEGRLGAPRVEFEVHTLSRSGTNAIKTYTAASLFGVAANRDDVHRAVRELYLPANATDLARRLLGFLEERMALVDP
jgi:hypothetical protein